MRGLSAFAAAFLAATAWAQPPEAVRFAPAQETRAALAVPDDWTAAASPFQRRATVGSEAAAATGSFLQALGRAARDCTPAERQRWQAAAGRALEWAREIRLPVPAPVTIACTDGSDMSGAPYTRGRTIFLPASFRQEPHTDPELMVHELVHVTTRAHPALATRLYRELGFEPVEPLEWPAEWLPVRIANPDAPHDRHATLVETPAGRRWVMPVVVAGRTHLRWREPYLAAAQVRVLAVEPGAGGLPTKPQRAGGQLLWWPLEALHGYLQRQGGNTGYLFHPEETLADNIAFLASGRPVPNPGLLHRLRAALAEPPNPLSTDNQENRP